MLRESQGQDLHSSGFVCENEKLGCPEVRYREVFICRVLLSSTLRKSQPETLQAEATASELGRYKRNLAQKESLPI